MIGPFRRQSCACRTRVATVIADLLAELTCWDQNDGFDPRFGGALERFAQEPVEDGDRIAAVVEARVREERTIDSHSLAFFRNAFRESVGHSRSRFTTSSTSLGQDILAYGEWSGMSRACRRVETCEQEASPFCASLMEPDCTSVGRLKFYQSHRSEQQIAQAV